MSPSSNLNRRVRKLEDMDTVSAMGRPFMWFSGQSLDDALAKEGLTLDQNLFAIEITSPDEAYCEKRELDRERFRLSQEAF